MLGSCCYAALEKSISQVCVTWYNGHLYHFYDPEIFFVDYLKRLYKNFYLNGEVSKRTTWIFLQPVQDKALRQAQGTSTLFIVQKTRSCDCACTERVLKFIEGRA